MRDKIHVLLVCLSYEIESFDSTDLMNSIFGSLAWQFAIGRTWLIFNVQSKIPHSSLHHLVRSLDKAEPRGTDVIPIMRLATIYHRRLRGKSERPVRTFFLISEQQCRITSFARYRCRSYTSIDKGRRIGCKRMIWRMLRCIDLHTLAILRPTNFITEYSVALCISGHVHTRLAWLTVAGYWWFTEHACRLNVLQSAMRQTAVAGLWGINLRLWKDIDHARHTLLQSWLS